MGTATLNFDWNTFQCSCPRCAEAPDNRVATRFAVIQAVQELRDRLGKPVVVTCGVRCKEHNAEIGGAPDSRHLPEHADAVDIACGDSTARLAIVWAAITGGWRCLEICKAHVHLDMRPSDTRILIMGEGP